MRYADLELGLHRHDAESCVVDLRFSEPESDADIRISPGRLCLARFDLAALSARASDALAYGRMLSDSLFAAPELRAAFARARTGAQALDIPLRLRLYIGPSVPELHQLHWETLGDPEGDGPLLGETIYFSRYLSSGDWRPVRLRPRSELRALVVVAAPSDLAAYRLAPIDAGAEAARARSSLGPVEVNVLAGSGQATLDQIVTRLRDGYDLLYLVAHGALIEGQPWLWLESAAGTTERVAAEALAEALNNLRERPRLVVLASCQSAGEGDAPQGKTTDALASLGPRLAEAGVPAVVAMQGWISTAGAARFMAAFCAELRRDGQIDRAVSVARAALADSLEAAAPVLFLRLRSGSIWYVPGFGEAGEGFEKWPALIRNIEHGQCTPILGPNLHEALLGTPREIAQRWAEEFRFPLAPYQRDDLPQVAQYLAVHQDMHFPRDELVEYERAELLRRFGALLANPLDDAPLERVFAAVAARHWADHPLAPHMVLAGLPFPIFITAGTDTLLEAALKAGGREPQVELCRWNDDLATLPSIFEADPGYTPSAGRPLVFHLFGVNSEPDSLVLTEDDYFDYLIGTSLNKDLIPVPVREALADTALLFLGFSLESWDFRVLFRSLMRQEGRQRRRRYAHIAGQVMPEEGRFLDPERARRYLERYFGGVDISIFWGSVDDFVQELARRSAARRPVHA